MNMIRFACAAMAGIGCALVGARLARGLTLREETLDAWLRALDALAAAVSYVDDPLPDVLERVGSNETRADARLADMFNEAAARMRLERALPFAKTLPSGWAYGLDQSDAAALSPLIRDLGGSARAQQIARIDSSRAALRRQAEYAADRTARQKRLYRSLGSLGGLALFLCLIG
ncbi:MAG: stage III sporulation protein AB [Oscillospiraceae bacterium]|jgi:stage III sporulation protein AB|nr:stage III sporulation protein AB [Oscillospiraceae bacterium]